MATHVATNHPDDLNGKTPLSADRTEAVTTHNVEKGGPATFPPPKKRGCKQHLKRFWWIYLLVIAAVILVVVLCIIFVAVPKIGQKEMNKSTLEITNQEVTDAKPNSVNIKLTSVAHSDSKYHASLDSFDASLFLLDTLPDIKPFGVITIPAAKVEKETVLEVSQQLDVANMEQFKAYNKLVIESETFSVGVRGNPKVKIGSLPKFGVDYNKVVTMKGLNGLKGFEVKKFNILLKAEADGSNMLGQIYIPNPSVLTVEMGNVTMDLSVGGTAIGQTLIPNLTLKPGNNTLDMRSTTDQAAVLKLIGSTYKDGILPVEIKGNSSINSAGEHLEYFEAAIQGNVLQTKLDVGAALGAIGINITLLGGGN